MTAPHPLTDETIAQYWPDADAADIRRQFDALMEKCAERPAAGFPRFPELMATVVKAEARLPAERVAALAMAIDAVPEHLRRYEWFAGKPAFGSQSVYGDDGRGMGRQAIASTLSGKAFNLAPFIAAASPRNVAALMAERAEHLRLLTILARTPYCAEEWTEAANKVDQILAEAGE